MFKPIETAMLYPKIFYIHVFSKQLNYVLFIFIQTKHKLFIT